MKNYLLCTFAAAISSVAFTSHAEERANNCQQLAQQQPVEIQLRAGDKFNNCFSLHDVPAGAEINIVSMAEAELAHSVRVYELNPQTSVEVIGDYGSNGSSVAQFSVPQNDKVVAFSVVPLAQQTQDKKLNIHYLHMGESPQVVIEMRNIASN